jgi:hypothetical protein
MNDTIVYRMSEKMTTTRILKGCSDTLRLEIFGPKASGITITTKEGETWFISVTQLCEYVKAKNGSKLSKSWITDYINRVEG